MVYSVADGKFTIDELQDVLRKKSLANMAAALKLRENEIAVNSEHFLTQEEMLSLQSGVTLDQVK